MPLDAVCLTALREELASTLIGSKIDRIAMPERDLVILSLHGASGKKKLLISARPGSARLHYTELSLENPPQPPMFCMLLRKYLLNARITGLTQPEMERLIVLEMDAVDDLGVTSHKRLILELMGKCRNLVLVGSDGRVIDCLFHAELETNSRRPLLPGLFYEYPPRQDKPTFFSLTPHERRLAFESTDPSAPADKRLLDTFSGLSPLLCREIACGEDIFAEMEKTAARIAEKRFEPLMLREGERPKDFSFMPIRQYGGLYQTERFESFSAMLDAFYTRRDRQDVLHRRAADLHRTVKTAHDRMQRKLAARSQELRDTEKREEYRRRGDLITANIYRLKRGMHCFTAQDYYSDGCPEVEIPLDPLKTPQQNAAINYKLYNKAKTASRILTELIREAEEELLYLESVMDELDRADCDRDLSDIRRELIGAGYIRSTDPKRQKLPAARKPMHFRSDSGIDIWVGRGNTENDQLTLKTARRTDLWLHVQKIPGSHVVVSQTEGKADECTIMQAAVLAATFSQAGGGKTPVDMTEIRFVKKPAGARPGRVIYTEYTTLITEPDPTLAERLRIE